MLKRLGHSTFDPVSRLSQRSNIASHSLIEQRFSHLSKLLAFISKCRSLYCIRESAITRTSGVLVSLWSAHLLNNNNLLIRFAFRFLSQPSCQLTLALVR